MTCTVSGLGCLLFSSNTDQQVCLLQEAVVLDPYAQSIVGRQQYGQLAKVLSALF